MKIKKGDKFKCILDYEMQDGAIVFKKGEVYGSYKDGTLPSLIDKTHIMSEEQDFKLHFKRVKQKVKKQSKKDFAIGFGLFLRTKCITTDYLSWFYNGKYHLEKELLEIYIKEKGL